MGVARLVLLYLLLCGLQFLGDSPGEGVRAFASVELQTRVQNGHAFRPPLIEDEFGVDRAPATIAWLEFSAAVPPIAIQRDLFIQVDAAGLIVQADGDGGDTAQRTGMFYFAFDDAAGFTHALDQLEIKPGIYIRHPNQPGFRSDPREFSRDQQRPLVIALGKYGMKDRLWRLTKAHLSRFGRYQNKDVIGPSHAGEYIRAFQARPFYPLLFVTDIGLVVSSMEKVMTASLDPSSTDDNNHIMALVQAQQRMPTPLSWLARKIYKWFRPSNPGNMILGETDPAQGALAWYHRIESGGNPLIAEAYRDAVAGF